MAEEVDVNLDLALQALNTAASHPLGDTPSGLPFAPAQGSFSRLIADYEPADEGELRCAENDTVLVMACPGQGEDGWAMAVRVGGDTAHGLVATNYIRETAASQNADGENVAQYLAVATEDQDGSEAPGALVFSPGDTLVCLDVDPYDTLPSEGDPRWLNGIGPVTAWGYLPTTYLEPANAPWDQDNMDGEAGEEEKEEQGYEEQGYEEQGYEEQGYDEQHGGEGGDGEYARGDGSDGAAGDQGRSRPSSARSRSRSRSRSPASLGSRGSVVSRESENDNGDGKDNGASPRTVSPFRDELVSVPGGESVPAHQLPSSEALRATALALAFREEANAPVKGGSQMTRPSGEKPVFEMHERFSQRRYGRLPEQPGDAATDTGTSFAPQRFESDLTATPVIPFAKCTTPFSAWDDTELALSPGELVVKLTSDRTGWWYGVKIAAPDNSPGDPNFRHGYIPLDCVRITDTTGPLSLGIVTRTRPAARGVSWGMDIREDQVVLVFGPAASSGWAYAALARESGMFPSACVVRTQSPIDRAGNLVRSGKVIAEAAFPSGDAGAGADDGGAERNGLRSGQQQQTQQQQQQQQGRVSSSPSRRVSHASSRRRASSAARRAKETKMLEPLSADGVFHSSQVVLIPPHPSAGENVVSYALAIEDSEQLDVNEVVAQKKRERSGSAGERSANDGSDEEEEDTGLPPGPLLLFKNGEHLIVREMEEDPGWWIGCVGKASDTDAPTTGAEADVSLWERVGPIGLFPSTFVSVERTSRDGSLCFVVATDDYNGVGDEDEPVDGAITFSSGDKLAAIDFNEDPGWWTGYRLQPPKSGDGGESESGLGDGQSSSATGGAGKSKAAGDSGAATESSSSSSTMASGAGASTSANDSSKASAAAAGPVITTKMALVAVPPMFLVPSTYFERVDPRDPDYEGFAGFAGLDSSDGSARRKGAKKSANAAGDLFLARALYASALVDEQGARVDGMGDWEQGERVAVSREGMGDGEESEQGWWTAMKTEMQEVVVMNTAEGEGAAIGGAGGAGAGGVVGRGVGGKVGVTLADRIFNTLVTDGSVEIPVALTASVRDEIGPSAERKGPDGFTSLVTKRTVGRRHASHSQHILPLDVGDTVYVLETLEDGTCYGALLGEKGSFPSTYVTPKDTIYGHIAVVQHAYSDEESGMELAENDLVVVTERTDGDGWWEGHPIEARGVFRNACLADDSRLRERKPRRQRRGSTVGPDTPGARGGDADADADSESDEEFFSDASFSDDGNEDADGAVSGIGADPIEGQPLYRVVQGQSGDAARGTLTTCPGDLLLVLSHTTGSPHSPLHALLLFPLIPVPGRCISADVDPATGCVVGTVVESYRFPASAKPSRLPAGTTGSATQPTAGDLWTRKSSYEPGDRLLLFRRRHGWWLCGGMVAEGRVGRGGVMPARWGEWIGWGDGRRDRSQERSGADQQPPPSGRQLQHAEVRDVVLLQLEQEEVPHAEDIAAGVRVTDDPRAVTCAAPPITLPVEMARREDRVRAGREAYAAMGRAVEGRFIIVSCRDACVTPRVLGIMSTALAKFQLLSRLDLSDNHLGVEGAQVVGKVIQQHARTLVHLNLTRCALGDRGAVEVVAGLASKRLRFLGLAQNAITDAGAAEVATMFASLTPPPTRIDLRVNLLTHVGALHVARAIRLWPSVRWSLSGNRIGPAGCAAIARALRVDHDCTVLSMRSVGMLDAGAVAIAELLSVNHSVRRIDLSDNRIGDLGAASLASTLLRSASAVTSLRLAGNCIRLPGIRSIAATLRLNATVTSVDLSRNRFDATGMRSLADALGHNPTIRRLVIRGCAVRDSACVRLADALATCKGLKELDLAGNGIGDEGARALAEMMRAKVAENASAGGGASATATRREREISEASGPNLSFLDLSDNMVGSGGCVSLVEAAVETGCAIVLEGCPIGQEGAETLSVYYSAAAGRSRAIAGADDLYGTDDALMPGGGTKGTGAFDAASHQQAAMREHNTLGRDDVDRLDTLGAIEALDAWKGGAVAPTGNYGNRSRQAQREGSSSASSQQQQSGALKPPPAPPEPSDLVDPDCLGDDLLALIPYTLGYIDDPCMLGAMDCVPGTVLGQRNDDDDDAALEGTGGSESGSIVTKTGPTSSLAPPPMIGALGVPFPPMTACDAGRREMEEREAWVDGGVTGVPPIHERLPTPAFLGPMSRLHPPPRDLASSALGMARFTGCGVGDRGVMSLARVMGPGGGDGGTGLGVRGIVLDHNGITGLGAASLAQTLVSASRRLRCVSLRGNPIGDVGGVAIADALFSCLSLRDLDLSYCQLGARAIETFATVLGGSGIVKLNLEGNGVPSVPMAALAAAVGGARRLSHLNLSRTSSGPDVAAALGDALPQCPTLRWLDLSHNYITDAVGSLTVSLRKAPGLTYLNLSGNGISNTGAQAISRSLLSARRRTRTEAVLRLRVLDLSDNKLRDSAIESLCREIPGACPYLRMLRLHRNDFTEQGAVSIAVMLRNVSVPLQVVTMHGNEIGGGGVSSIAEAVKGTPGAHLRGLTDLTRVAADRSCARAVADLSVPRAAHHVAMGTVLRIGGNPLGAEGLIAAGRAIRKRRGIPIVAIDVSDVQGSDPSALSQFAMGCLASQGEEPQVPLVVLVAAGNRVVLPSRSEALLRAPLPSLPPGHDAATSGRPTQQPQSQFGNTLNTPKRAIRRSTSEQKKGASTLSLIGGTGGTGVHGYKTLSHTASGLFKLILHSPWLRVIDLSRCELGVVGMASLAAAINKLPYLSHLDASDNAGGDEGMRVLLASLMDPPPPLVVLSLGKNSMSSAVAGLLSSTLAVLPFLQTLDVSHNAFGERGMDELCPALGAHPTLTSVNVASNRAGPAAGALAKALRDSASIKRCCAAGNIFGRTASSFNVALASSTALEELDLSDNLVPDAALIALCPGVVAACGRNLTTLNLRRNLIGDNGVVSLCDALAGRTGRLGSLLLGGNSFGAEGGEALGRLLMGGPGGTDSGGGGIWNIDIAHSGGGGGGICEAMGAGASAGMRMSIDLSATHATGSDVDKLLKEAHPSTVVCLENCPLGRRGGVAVGKFLTTSAAMTVLRLSRCELGDKGLADLCAALGSNFVVREVDFSFNGVGVDGAMALGECMASNYAVTSLNLSGNPLGPDGIAEVCAGLFRRTLTSRVTLDVSGTQCGDDGVADGLAPLFASGRVRVLRARSNGLTHLCAPAVADTLYLCEDLAEFDVGDNPGLGDEGGCAVLDSCLGLQLLRVLRLDACGLSIGAFSRASRVIEVLGTLGTVDVSDNAASEASMSVFSQSLSARGNTGALDRLSMDNCGMGDAALAALSTAWLTASPGHGSKRISGAAAQKGAAPAGHKGGYGVGPVVGGGGPPIYNPLHERNEREGSGGGGGGGARRIYEGPATLLVAPLGLHRAPTVLSLRHNGLQDIAARTLGAVIRHNESLRCLDLRNNTLGNAGVASLCKGLALNRTLHTLRLDMNPSLSDDAAASVAEAMHHSTALVEVTMTECSVGPPGARTVYELLTESHVERVFDLSGNPVGASGLTAFVRSMSGRRLPATGIISFPGARIKDDDIVAMSSYLSEELRRLTSITRIDLGGNKIGRHGVAALLPCLTSGSCNVLSLNLSGNKLGKDEARQIAEAIDANRSLCSVNLCANKIGPEGAVVLAAVVAAHPTIVSLNLEWCGIGDQGANAIAQALASNKGLDIPLTGNGVAHAGVAIARTLAANTATVTVKLGYNLIGTVGVEALCKSLEANRAVTSIVLSENQLRDSAVPHIVALLQANPLITQVSLSRNFITDDGAVLLFRELALRATPVRLAIAGNRISDELFAQYEQALVLLD